MADADGATIVEIEEDVEQTGDAELDDARSTLSLGPILRHVDERSATVWLEVARPSEVTILDHSTPTFTVEGRHYALVVIEGLEPGRSYPYEVRVDDEVVWPDPDSEFPASVIRTAYDGMEPRVLFGSCRAAAPHHPPFSLERTMDHEARGVDALWAHAHRMREQPPAEWPDLLLFLGDQIYADDSSPAARERIERRRSDDLDLPAAIVVNYDDYCLLYHEAWEQEAERWLLSTVPSSMIFDDHDMIDDWNISASWVAEIREEPWWRQHAVAGLMSYLVHQHLGNLSPEDLDREGLLEAAVRAGDATEVLRNWAEEVDASVGSDSGYRFSHCRRLGRATVVVVDCRQARILDETERAMVGPAEWEWVRERCLDADGHVIIGTSLPVFIADGLHDLQVWNEYVCRGRWGRRGAAVGERIRRALDLEDWSAFERSYRLFNELLLDLADTSCRSVIVASGDIHFSYAAAVGGPVGDGLPVWQIVSSPIRNALIPPERGVMRTTLTAAGRRFGSLLRRTVGAPDTRPGIELLCGPVFANAMCLLDVNSAGHQLRIEQARQDPDGPPKLEEVAMVDLRCGPDL